MIAFIDLDGTIIDSFKRHYILLKRILNKYGVSKKFLYDDYREKKTDGLNNIKYMTDVLNISDKLAKEIQKEWIDNIESKEMLNFDVLYNDSIDFLEFLKQEGYDIIFLTARNNEKLTLLQLKKLGLYKYSKKVIIVNTENSIANKSAIIDREKNNDCIMVGDTEVDYKSSKNCQIDCYILNRGFRSLNFLNQIGVKKSYTDLYKIMEELYDKKL